MTRVVYDLHEKSINTHYVYMMLCQDDGPIYVKVGMARDVLKRLAALKTGCPIKPHQLAFLDAGTRRKARILEIALHLAFDKWRVCGEWFRLKPEEKQDFNKAWKSVLQSHSRPGYSFRWKQIPISGSDMNQVALKRAFFRSLFKECSPVQKAAVDVLRGQTKRRPKEMLAL